MKEDRRDDLVSTTAIIAGAAVSVAVTVASILMSGEESVPQSIQDLVAAPEMEYVDAASTDWFPMDQWTDPRGPERGPTALEWDVIGAYKPIESMTAAESGDPMVEEALVQLETLARQHRENPFIQELHLKGLRITTYWAVAAGDLDRAGRLSNRFETEAPRAPQSEGVALESMRMIVQRLEQSCDGLTDAQDELQRIASRYPGEEVERTWLWGVDAAETCADG